MGLACKWLREQATGLKLADSLDRAAADWERNERSPEWLIGGVRLAAAKELADSPVFRDRVRRSAEFLEASREHQDAEAKAELLTAQAHAAALRKRARILRAVLAVTLVSHWSPWRAWCSPTRSASRQTPAAATRSRTTWWQTA